MKLKNFFVFLIVLLIGTYAQCEIPTDWEQYIPKGSPRESPHRSANVVDPSAEGTDYSADVPHRMVKTAPLSTPHSTQNEIPTDWEEYIPPGSPRVSPPFNRTSSKESPGVELPIETFSTALDDSEDDIWEGGVVPYLMDKTFDFDRVNMISSVMKDIQNISCVRFIPRTTELDYVLVQPGDGCSSEIGRKGGMQSLGLNKLRCFKKGIIAHELLHTLGFRHEHTRPDRDKFIRVIYSNIDKGKYRQFRMSQRTQNFASGYDFGSIMHYGLFDFAINKSSPTMMPLKKGIRTPVGQRDRFSRTDMARLNFMYDCPVGKPPNRVRHTTQSPLDAITRIPKQNSHSLDGLEQPVQRAIRWLGNYARGCSFSSPNIESRRHSHQHCSDACEGTLGCTHFVHRPNNNGGSCFFMDGSVSKENAIAIDDFSVVCGVVGDNLALNDPVQRVIKWNESWAQGCRFNSPSFETATMKSNRCRKFCGMVDECTHFSWQTTGKDGRCSLYSGEVTRADAVSDVQSVLYGIVSAAPVAGSTADEGSWSLSERRMSLK